MMPKGQKTDVVKKLLTDFKYLIELFTHLNSSVRNFYHTNGYIETHKNGITIKMLS